jgi:hypothetical protein
VLLEKVEKYTPQITSFEVLLSFRRLVVVHSRADTVDTGEVVEHCYVLLEGILSRQEKLDLISWNQSKAAVLQQFCSLASTLKDSVTWSKFLERFLLLPFLLIIEFSRILRKFYANEDRCLLVNALDIFKAMLAHISPVCLPHVITHCLTTANDVGDVHYRTAC